MVTTVLFAICITEGSLEIWGLSGKRSAISTATNGLPCAWLMRDDSTKSSGHPEPGAGFFGLILGNADLLD